MKGYFNDPEATDAAIRDGWFHTGDIAVVHPDGYAEIRDRLKDVIISGGENISSVEVEGVILRHPAVEEVAVVGMPHFSSAVAITDTSAMLLRSVSLPPRRITALPLFTHRAAASAVPRHPRRERGHRRRQWPRARSPAA